MGREAHALGKFSSCYRAQLYAASRARICVGDMRRYQLSRLSRMVVIMNTQTLATETAAALQAVFEAVNAINAELPSEARPRIQAAAKRVFQAKAAIMAEVMT